MSYHPSPESPFIYTPNNTTPDLSEVSIVFEPSDELQLSLGQFVKPEMRQRFKAHLKSDTVAVLPVTGGDSSGWKHWHTRGESRDAQSDTEWLRDYDKTIRSLGGHAIPLANVYPAIETLQNGSLAIELPLLPDRETIKKIGRKILKPVTYMRDDEEVYKEIMRGRLIIPESKLADYHTQVDAVQMLLEKLGAEVHSTYQPAPSSSRLYVSHPFVTDKLAR